MCDGGSGLAASGDPFTGSTLPPEFEGLQLGPGQPRAMLDVDTHRPFFTALHDKVVALMTGLLTSGCADVGLLRGALITVIDAGILWNKGKHDLAELLAMMQAPPAQRYQGAPAADEKGDSDDDDDAGNDEKGGGARGPRPTP